LYKSLDEGKVPLNTLLGENIMAKDTLDFKEEIIEKFELLKKNYFKSGWECSLYDDPEPRHTSAWSLTLNCKEDEPNGDHGQRRSIALTVTYYPPGDRVYKDGAAIIESRSRFTGDSHNYPYEDYVWGSGVTGKNVYKWLRINVQTALDKRKSNPRKGTSVLGALILGGIIGHSMKK
jgi:hypothetical protein